MSSELTQHVELALKRLMLSQVIAQVESSNFQYGMRFEPTVYEYVSQVREDTVSSTIYTIKESNRCDLQTAFVIYATSFGKYQIMGETLYSELRYLGAIGSFMASEQMQKRYFDSFVTRKGIDFTPTQLYHVPDFRQKFATLYNGCEDGAYEKAILKAIEELTA